MRTDDGWTDIVIRNISPRGMLVRAAAPPPAGTYVEIRCARLAIVGRAVWAKHPMIGIRLQDRLQIDALLGRTALAPGGSPAGPSAGRALAGVADRSRDRARQLQYLAMLLVFGLAAAAIAHTVAITLAVPFDAVRDGMKR